MNIYQILFIVIPTALLNAVLWGYWVPTVVPLINKTVAVAAIALDVCILAWLVAELLHLLGNVLRAIYDWLGSLR